MNNSELKAGSGPNGRVRPDWNEGVIVEQIWNDLQGTVERSTIYHELTQVIPRFQNARVKTYVPIFLRRVTTERLRARVAGAVPTDTVEPTGATSAFLPTRGERSRRFPGPRQLAMQLEEGKR